MEAYLSDAFLDRVRRAYRRALEAGACTRGRLWQAIDARRHDVHESLLAEGNESIRAVFADPITTDLYFGVDDLCRSTMERGKWLYRQGRYGDGRPFLELALKSPRATLAQYQSERVVSALQSLGGNSVIEIGPGVGHCALFSHHAGIDYTTIDLPLGMVAQACFLSRLIGPENIWMAGDLGVGARNQIKLFSVAHLPDCQYDIALNVDSMTEMSLAAALDYAGWINRHARLFISINHELNPFRIADIARAKLDIAKSSRSLWAPRDGYFEEMFLIGQKVRRKCNLLIWLHAKTFFWRAYGAAKRRLPPIAFAL